MAADRPPLGVRAKYHLLGLTPPVEYRSWVLEDVASLTWPLRYVIQVVAMFAVLLSLMSLLGMVDTAGFLDEVTTWPMSLVWVGFLLAAPHRRGRLKFLEWRWASMQGQGESGITGPASPE